jgi:cytochrome c biogenesis protein CcdA/thiol-disulfide isomerase/thioredoxin
MVLYFLSYIGGLITILSPCILPVLPFVFTKADQPFRKSGLPLLLGMAITFTAFSMLAVIGGAWVTEANQWGRYLALALLLFFGLSLIFPHLLEVLLSPLAGLGGKLSSQPNQQRSVSKSIVLGMATGLLWAPCAGPILGLILTGSAIQGGEHGVWTSASYLLAYALGAGTSLGLALVAGGKLFGTMKKYLKAERVVRVVLGCLVILGVLAISLHWDRSLLTQISKVQTESLEQKLLQTFHVVPENKPYDAKVLAVEGKMPELSGAVTWINSVPLAKDSLKGKVVLIDFWTYSCINCLRTLPYVKAWNEKYKDSGLIVIGVHTPEFAFEKNIENVKKAVSELGVTYSVAVDNDYNIWNAFQNRYWPAHYFIDRQGNIRHHHFGEGEYEESEKVIQELLNEGQGAKPKFLEQGFVKSQGQGALASPELSQVKSFETYIGDSRAENRVENYQPSQSLKLNQWALLGDWQVDAESATLTKASGKIVFRFHARDLHLVLGSKTNKEIRFQVTMDGKALGENHGADTDAAGKGIVKEHKLYQLIRQKENAEENSEIQDHTFEIEFLDPGVQAFAFTFG